MNAEIVFALGAAGGALLYHLLVVPRLAKATSTAIKNAEKNLEKTTSLRGDLSTIQEALEAYDRVCQVNPEFRNVADRVKALRVNAEQTDQGREGAPPGRSGPERPRGRVWRFLFGNQK